jgi:predicted RNase H-like nuclease (RuvC/YqgF family)
MSTKEAFDRAMEALEEDRWLSPVSIDAIRAHLVAKDAEIETRDQYISDLERQLSSKDAEIEELKQQIAALRARIEASEKVWLGFRVEDGEVHIEPAATEEEYDFLIRDDPEYHKSGYYYAVPVEKVEVNTSKISNSSGEEK